jgi:hypothetical protein
MGKKKIFGLRWAALVAGLLLVPLCLGTGELYARKKPKPPQQFSSLSFLVLKASSGKPIRHASVIIHFLRPDGSQESDGIELKTDRQGRTVMNDIPYGRLRLQVIAPRLQTFGEDVEINAPQQQFVIRLNPPAAQISDEP